MTTTPYDDVADWYDEHARSSWEYPGDENDLVATLFRLTGDVDGLNVCDPARGQGTITRRLARAGADVVGVDISSRLLIDRNTRGNRPPSRREVPER